MVVGRIHVPVQNVWAAPRRIDEPGILGPTPGTHAMAWPKACGRLVHGGPTTIVQSVRVGDGINPLNTTPSYRILDLDLFLLHFLDGA